MTLDSPQPIRLDPHSPTELSLGWNNGENYVVPYLELRFLCPCAACVDEHTGKRTLKRESLKPDVRPLAIHPIGRYALQIDWSDRHSTGMYSFEGLYRICKNINDIGEKREN